MATDLFKKYYDNPAKQYIYAGITCPGASSSSDGSSSTVLQPNSVTVIRGVTSGESRMTRGFGRIPECVISEKD